MGNRYVQIDRPSSFIKICPRTSTRHVSRLHADAGPPVSTLVTTISLGIAEGRAYNKRASRGRSRHQGAIMIEHDGAPSVRVALHRNSCHHIPSPPESFSRLGGSALVTLLADIGSICSRRQAEADGCVLDVGCGLAHRGDSGRIPHQRRYEGFDVDMYRRGSGASRTCACGTALRFQAAEVFSDKYRSSGTKRKLSISLRRRSF